MHAPRFRASKIPILLVVTVTLGLAAQAAAAPQPTSLSITPSTISQGQCYTMIVGGGANMTIDYKVTFNGGPEQTVIGFPTLNSIGRATICSTQTLAVGLWRVTAIRNTLNTAWVTVNAPVTVIYPQPTGLSITPTTIEQGQCYTMIVSNGANMTIDYKVRYNGGPEQTVIGFPTLNSLGRATICSTQTLSPGVWRVTAIRNTLNTPWVTVNVPVTVLYPQPTSLVISPSTITQGDCYTMIVGNGANMTIDYKVTYNGGPEQTVIGFPTLNFQGRATICSTQTLSPGVWRVTAIRNTLNAPWVTVNVPVTVNAPQPTSLSVSPTILNRGANFTLTIGNGASLEIDYRYRIDGGAEIVRTVTLGADGKKSIGTAGEPVGKYRFTGVRNHLNTAWVPVDDVLTVLDACPLPGPLVPLGDRSCDELPPAAARAAEPPGEFQVHEALGAAFRDYALETVEPQQLRRDLDRVGRITLPIGRRDQTLVLEPNDLRAPTYRDLVVDEFGERLLPAAPVGTFKGRVEGEARSDVRLAVADDLVFGYVEVDGERYFVEPASNYAAGAAPEWVVVYREDDLRRQPGLTCGMTETLERASEIGLPPLEPGGLGAGAGLPAGLAGSPVLEIATDSDAEYSALHGNAPSLYIQGVLNMVEGIYNAAGVEVDLVVIQQITRTSLATDPYDSCDFVGLWCELRHEWEEHRSTVVRDFVHLFSGKRVFYQFPNNPLQRIRGTAGFHAQACTPSDKAYVFTTNYREAGLAAHEIGHALDAVHDDGNVCPNAVCSDCDCCRFANDPGCQAVGCPDPDPAGGPVMCSSIQEPITGLSQASIDAISGHLGTFCPGP